MVGKVTPDAVDAVHWKTATAHYGNARNLGGGNHIVAHARILKNVEA